MPRLPKLVASSVVRGSMQGESHGGVYLIDTERGESECRIDWSRTDIDVSGRGGDRGLRGIALHGERVVLAASTRIWLLDPDLRCIGSLANRYLHHCHEIAVHGSRLFITSTGYDSILVLDLRRGRFTHGLHLSLDGGQLRLRSFDPEDSAGPPPSRAFHLNSISCHDAGVYFSGLRTPGLLSTDGRTLRMIQRLPQGTHNAQRFQRGILYNDTASDRVCYEVGGVTRGMQVPAFPRDAVVRDDACESGLARAGFARGLAPVSQNLVAGGSSPSTISIYDLTSATRIATHNVSMDVRNAIHGLAIWPF